MAYPGACDMWHCSLSSNSVRACVRLVLVCLGSCAKYERTFTMSGSRSPKNSQRKPLLDLGTGFVIAESFGWLPWESGWAFYLTTTPSWTLNTHVVWVACEGGLRGLANLHRHWGPSGKALASRTMLDHVRGSNPTASPTLLRWHLWVWSVNSLLGVVLFACRLAIHSRLSFYPKSLKN